jgi:phage shock protein A
MRFIDRFIKLAKADAHGVLDSLEDPSLILKQCLREAERELTDDQSHRDELVRWLEQLSGEREAAAQRGKAIDEEIRLAIEEGAEDLARFSIRRLLATQRKTEVLEDQIRSSIEELSSLESRIGVRESELDELRRDVEAHLSRERAHSAGCAVSPENAEVVPFIRDEEVELELLRRRRETADPANRTTGVTR